MGFVRISPGSAVTAADIATFDAMWLRPEHHADLVANHVKWWLSFRRIAMVWEVSERMVTLARMHELTLATRYLDQLRDFIEIVLQFRDDRHPGSVSSDGETFPAQPRDEYRGRVMPAWGESGISNGGFHEATPLVAGLYCYPIAAFGRIVAENPALHAAYGDAAVGYVNAVAETALAYIPEIRFREAGNFVEACFTHPEGYRTRPTESQCVDAHRRAVSGDPLGDMNRYQIMLGNCRNMRRLAGHPLPHNQSLAFAMALIEQWLAIDSPFYRQSPARAAEAATALHPLLPLLVSRMQRHFVNRLRTVGNEPARQRFFWHYADEVPPGVNIHPEDTSHGALDLRYIEVLRRNLNRLNVLPASLGEPIPLSDSHLKRFANTFMQKISRGGADFAANVEGAPSPGRVNNSNADGWMNLAVANEFVYQICHNVSTQVVDGTQLYLIIGVHSALLMNKRFSRRYRYYEGTRSFAAASSAGPPSAIFLPASRRTSVVYRDQTGRLHELWRIGSEAGVRNLSELAGNAKLAGGDPRLYVDTAGGRIIAVYRGVDGHVYSLYWSGDHVGRDSLSRPTAGALPAAGGRLNEIWWQHGGAPSYLDITFQAAAPLARDKPSALIVAGPNTHHAFYWGDHSAVHEICWV